MERLLTDLQWGLVAIVTFVSLGYFYFKTKINKERLSQSQN